MTNTKTETRSKRRRARLALAALAAALLAGGGAARAGFPTFDAAAFGQRLQQAISSNAQVASLASLVTNTSSMITTLDSQLSQALRAAEGQINALTSWNALFPTAEVLGTATEVQGWIARAGTLRDRAGRVASGALAALPAEADFRAAWNAAPSGGIGTPVLPPAAATRADLAAQGAQERAAVFGRLDELASQRSLAAERHARLLEDVRARLEDIAGDSEVSATGLQQKQLSAAAAAADIEAALLQMQALREELEIEKAVARREAAAELSRQSLAGVRAVFAGTAAMMARFDRTAADTAFAGQVRPTY